MDGVKVFDKYGTEQDWAWLVQEFGPVEIWTAKEAGAYWAVAELHEVDDIPAGEKAGVDWTIQAPAVLVARVYGVLGGPAPGVLVARRWPYAEPNPELETLPMALWTHFNEGVYGQTNENGDIGFGMGGGDFYDPSKQAGASSVWVGGNSELVSGLGMVTLTNHRHLNVVFRWYDEPAPGPGPKTLIRQAIDKLQQALDGMPSDVDGYPF